MNNSFSGNFEFPTDGALTEEAVKEIRYVLEKKEKKQNFSTISNSLVIEKSSLFNNKRKKDEKIINNVEINVKPCCRL